MVVRVSAFHPRHAFDQQRLILGIEAGQRFVEHQILGITQQRLGQHHALALAAGKHRERALGVTGRVSHFQHAVDFLLRRA